MSQADPYSGRPPWKVPIQYNEPEDAPDDDPPTGEPEFQLADPTPNQEQPDPTPEEPWRPGMPRRDIPQGSGPDQRNNKVWGDIDDEEDDDAHAPIVPPGAPPIVQSNTNTPSTPSDEDDEGDEGGEGGEGEDEEDDEEIFSLDDLNIDF